ncbi:MAG: Crp/Fnr family transcriptional regulator [Actinomycetota bacterium]
MSESLERVRQIPLFAELEDPVLAKVAEVCSGFEVPAGHVLVEHAQPGSGMFCITEGTVVVELPTGPVELGPGEFVGELAILADGVMRVARVRAVTPVKGLAIGRAAFAELLRDEPRVAVGMLPVLARRLAEAESP